MIEEPETTAIDRVVFSFLGGIAGAAYGALICLVFYFVTGQVHTSIIVWSVIVFACLGIFYDNFICEALLGLLHFFWGLLNGFAENSNLMEQDTSKNYFRSFLLIGFGTGIVLSLWWYL